MSKMFMAVMFLLFLVGCNPAKPAQEIQVAGGSYENFTQQAEMLLSQGKLEEAVKSYEQAIQMNPSDTRSYFSLAQVFMRIGAMDNAIGVLTESLRFDPQDGNAYLLMAGCYDLKGERDRAIELVQIALAAYQEKKDEQGFQSALQVLQQLNPEGFPPKVSEQL